MWGKMGNSFKKSDWRVLLRSIESGNCILLLGPDLNVTTPSKGNFNLAADLAKVLADELETRDTGNLGSLDLPMIAQAFQHEKKARDYLMAEVEEHLEKHDADLALLGDPTFEGLASLPFSMIVTTRHDNTMEKYLSAAFFDGKPKEPWTDFYDKKGIRQAVLKNQGTCQAPLIYQLFGSAKESSSMVMTEKDRLDFLKSIASNNPGLPKNLISKFKETNFLFVGFDLPDHHLKVLMHVLELNPSAQSFALESLPAQPDARSSDSGAEEPASAEPTAFQESVLFYEVAGFTRLRLMETKIEDFVSELCKRWKDEYGDTTLEEKEADTTPDEEEDEANGDDPSTDRDPIVFLSYASENVAQAKQLAEIFRKNGLNPWLDKEKLYSGANWEKRLETAVKKDVDYFVVLQSRHVNDYEESYVLREVNYALDRRKNRSYEFIFPAKIDQKAKRIQDLDDLKLQTRDVYDIEADGAAFAQTILRVELDRRQRQAEA